MRRIAGLTLGLVVLATGTAEAEKVSASLRGSPAAMVQQNRVAKDHRLTFFRTGAEIEAAARRGDLVTLVPNEDYDVADFVRYPYLQPAAALFVERLAAQYREACGQRLVVTSAVRPTTGQPSNAHRLSVHPAGMAVDLRVSDRALCRNWLETAILNMERRGVINGIREFRPPHYHIAVFPEPYLAYVEERLAAEPPVEEEPEPVVAAHTDIIQEAVAAGAASLMPVAEPVDEGSPARTPLAAALLALTALPFGIRALLRRRR